MSSFEENLGRLRDDSREAADRLQGKRCLTEFLAAMSSSDIAPEPFYEVSSTLAEEGRKGGLFRQGTNDKYLHQFKVVARGWIYHVQATDGSAPYRGTAITTDGLLGEFETFEPGGSSWAKHTSSGVERPVARSALARFGGGAPVPLLSKGSMREPGAFDTQSYRRLLKVAAFYRGVVDTTMLMGGDFEGVEPPPI